jgi:hypothetical protein
MKKAFAAIELIVVKAIVDCLLLTVLGREASCI